LLKILEEQNLCIVLTDKIHKEDRGHNFPEPILRTMTIHLPNLLPIPSDPLILADQVAEMAEAEEMVEVEEVAEMEEIIQVEDSVQDLP